MDTPQGTYPQADRDSDYPRVEPARRTVATFRRYEDAQAAVDFLSDRRFPVQHLAIVGEGLRSHEQVTGRRGYGQAALDGAVSAGIAGAFLGFIFGLFSIVEPLVSGLALAFYGLLIGAVIGAILGLVGHAASGGRRDFSSVTGMTAERYDVVADGEVAEDAERLLAEFQQRRI